MKSWSPWKSWWLDLLKFGITFFIGAVMTITVLDTLEERRSNRVFVARKAWERDVATVEEFRAASLQYVQATEDAMAEASQRRADAQNEIVRRWKEDAHDRILLSLETINDRFSNRSNQVGANLREIEELQRVLYAEFQELREKDSEPGAYWWSDTLIRLKELRKDTAQKLELIISDNR